MLSRSLLFIVIVLCSFSALANDAHAHAQKGEWKIVFQMLRDGKVGLNTIKDGKTLFDIAMETPRAVNIMLAFSGMGAQVADDLDPGAAEDVQPLDEEQLEKVCSIIEELEDADEEPLTSPRWDRRHVPREDVATPFSGFGLAQTPELSTIDGLDSIPLTNRRDTLEAQDDDGDDRSIVQVLDFSSTFGKLE